MAISILKLASLVHSPLARIVLEDKGVDAVLVILTPQAMTNPTTTAKAVGELAGTTAKPILSVWLGGNRMQEGIRLLNEAGVPTYATPEQGVRAFMILVQYSRNLESLYQTPKDIPVQFPLDRKQLREQFDSLFYPEADAPIQSEEMTKKFLESYGIPSWETIYARFRYFFQWESYEAATRYCYIDYDREIAIVAEYNHGCTRRLVGVGRLIADPNHETAEYAVLISDEWQNKGLGSILTDFCLEIAEKWGVTCILAETTTDNHRMISLLEKRMFDIKPAAEGSLVEVSKLLK